jgi:hypothetical protein
MTLSSNFQLPFSAPSATLREQSRIMEPNEVSAQMVDAACKIHIELGPGLLETGPQSNEEARAESLRLRRKQNPFGASGTLMTKISNIFGWI